MAKKNLSVTPSTVEQAAAFPVSEISAKGLVSIRVDGQERQFNLAAVEENGELRLILAMPQ